MNCCNYSSSLTHNFSNFINGSSIINDTINCNTNEISESITTKTLSSFQSDPSITFLDCSFIINNKYDNKYESLDFDNLSFFIDIPDNYSIISSNSNIDFSNVNPINDELNISFVNNIDNEYIYLFKENQNNNIQNIETHENEEVVEKIEENNNIENESEFSLSLESQKDLARNSIKE